MSRDVWELLVFRRAYALSLELHRASQGWPRSAQLGGIGEQLRRSSKSVCALLAEGAGRQRGPDPEFRRFCVMALGSVEEAKLWCRYAADLGLAGGEAAEAWQQELGEIARMLQALVKRLCKPA